MEMTDDLARLILLVGFAVVAPVGIYHRVRSRTDERLDRRQEGWLILLSLRPLALAFMAGMVAFLVKPSSMAWASFHLPNWARWSGVGLGAGAAGLIIWTFRSLGHNLTDTVVTRRDATLIIARSLSLGAASLLLGICHGGDRKYAGHRQCFSGCNRDRSFPRDCWSHIDRGEEAY